jgi:glycosyltransferase involved in cell wall biosynthesis
MPVLNSGEYLSPAIESILNQSLNNIELLIFDGGSEDGSQKTILEWAMRDNRVIPMDTPEDSINVADRTNIMMHDAQGKYIAMAHGDDISAPDRLSKQYFYMEEMKIDVCGTFLKLFQGLEGEWKYPQENSMIKTLLSQGQCPFGCPSMMLNKRLVDRGFIFNGSYRVALDLELWLRLAIEKDVVMSNVPECLVQYRYHPKQSHRKEAHLYGSELPRLNPLLQKLQINIAEWRELGCF